MRSCTQLAERWRASILMKSTHLLFPRPLEPDGAETLARYGELTLAASVMATVQQVADVVAAQRAP